MKIIVVGLGKIGLAIVKELTKEGHDIIGIDIKSETVEKTVNYFDINGICGNGSSYDILKEAGAENASLIIATTKNDETNILCCILAKSLGTKYSVARIRQPEYELQFQNIKDKINIDYVINPEKECAKEIVRMLRFPFATRVESFTKDIIECLEFEILPKNRLCGKMLKNIIKQIKAQIIVSFVIREHEVIIPNGDFKIQANDSICIVGKTLEVANFLKNIQISSKKIHSVLIVGGGKISFYLAEILLSQKQNAKILEKDKKICLDLSEKLPNACIICGDAIDKSILVNEGLNGVDACVSLTGMDEANILISLYSRNQNVETIIPKINSETYTEILEEIKLKNFVSPKTIASNKILRFVRALDVPKDSSLISLYKLANEKVEALEFNLNDNQNFVGKQLKDIKLKQNILLSCLIRERDAFVPNGETVFCSQDQLIVTTTRNDIKRIEDILQ